MSTQTSSNCCFGRAPFSKHPAGNGGWEQNTCCPILPASTASRMMPSNEYILKIHKQKLLKDSTAGRQLRAKIPSMDKSFAGHKSLEHLWLRCLSGYLDQFLLFGRCWVTQGKRKTPSSLVMWALRRILQMISALGCEGLSLSPSLWVCTRLNERCESLVLIWMGRRQAWDRGNLYNTSLERKEGQVARDVAAGRSIIDLPSKQITENRRQTFLGLRKWSLRGMPTIQGVNSGRGFFVGAWSPGETRPKISRDKFAGRNSLQRQIS